MSCAPILKHYPLVNTSFYHLSFRWTIPLSSNVRLVYKKVYKHPDSSASENTSQN
jgi:hypothetical protein